MDRRSSGDQPAGNLAAVLLYRPFPDPVLNLTLEVFVREVTDVFGPRLISVTLYGSVVFGDLAPGFGDLDFLVVAEGDLTDEDANALIDVRRGLRSGAYGILAHMLEGAFLPRPMLDPRVAGSALWWGTSGERMWGNSRLGPLVENVIRTEGLVAFGRDLRLEIPEPSREAMVAEVLRFADSMRDYGEPGTLHSVGWLLEAARQVRWLREGRTGSKTEAARWGADCLEGAWPAHLARASELRRCPSLLQGPGKAEWEAWLGSLRAPILEAEGAVRDAVKLYGGASVPQ